MIGVGGFLGMGEHLVAVPFEKVQWVDQPVEHKVSSTERTTTTGSGTSTATAPRQTTTTTTTTTDRDRGDGRDECSGQRTGDDDGSGNHNGPGWRSGDDRRPQHWDDGYHHYGQQPERREQ